MAAVHRPVLIREVIDFLKVSEGGVYLDATFGEGGHTLEILRQGAAKVVALDQDETAIAEGRKLVPPQGSLVLAHVNFEQVENAEPDVLFDGALMDLGVSTKQITSSERGFSFQRPGPLDMRMDDTRAETLAAVLSRPAADLEAFFLNFFSPKQAAYYAKSLSAGVKSGRIQSTGDLVALTGPRHGKTHSATTLFLALRMLVNRELECLESALPKMLRRLKPGGRLVVISFHSLEDRIVKNIFRSFTGNCKCEIKPCACPKTALASLITKKPLVPGRVELRENPRARSAKLRCVEKI